jgi:nitrate/nitrite transporter NarK
MFGILASLGNLGGMVMPWVVGSVADASNMRRGLLTAIICPILMVVLLLWLRGRVHRHADPHDAPAIEAI